MWFVETIFGFLMCCGLGCPHHQETTRTHVLLFIHVGDQKWTDKYKRPLVNLGAIQDSLIISKPNIRLSARRIYQLIKCQPELFPRTLQICHITLEVRIQNHHTSTSVLQAQYVPSLMEKPTLIHIFNFPCLLDLGHHSTTKNTENPA